MARGERDPRRQPLRRTGPASAAPCSLPSFLGSLLLLFANAFSSYATAAALVGQANSIVSAADPAAPSSARPCSGRANMAGAIALGMLVVMVVVMLGYSALVRAHREVAAMSRAVTARASARQPALGPGPPACIIWRWSGSFFLVPLISWSSSLRTGSPAATARPLDRAVLRRDHALRPRLQGIGNSLVLAVVTVAIVLLRAAADDDAVSSGSPAAPRAGVRLPPADHVPAIVLVVGLAPVYAVVAKVFGGRLDARLRLRHHRAALRLPGHPGNIAAVDVVTLSEAARSLGAGWMTVLWRVLLPNLRRGILAASVHLGRGRAGRVHDRVAAQPRQPADRAAADRRSPTRSSRSSSRSSRWCSRSSSSSSSAASVRSRRRRTAKGMTMTALDPRALRRAPASTVELRGVVQRLRRRTGRSTASTSPSRRASSSPCSAPRGCGKTTALRALAGLERGRQRQHPDRRRAMSPTCPPTAATSAWCSSRTRCSRT